jgi:hypothetical protein
MSDSNEKEKEGWRPVRVECYSGARLNERPRWILEGPQRLEIVRILEETSVEERDRPGSRVRLFKVVAEDAGVYLLQVLEGEDRWLLKTG